MRYISEAAGTTRASPTLVMPQARCRILLPVHQVGHTVPVVFDMGPQGQLVDQVHRALPEGTVWFPSVVPKDLAMGWVRRVAMYARQFEGSRVGVASVH